MDYQLFEQARREILLAGWGDFFWTIVWAAIIVVVWVLRARALKAYEEDTSPYKSYHDDEGWNIGAVGVSVVCGLFMALSIACAIDNFVNTDIAAKKTIFSMKVSSLRVKSE